MAPSRLFWCLGTAYLLPPQAIGRVHPGATPKGPNGPQGPKGLKGPRAQGPKGPEGPKSTLGHPGMPGMPGMPSNVGGRVRCPGG